MTIAVGKDAFSKMSSILVPVKESNEGGQMPLCVSTSNGDVKIVGAISLSQEETEQTKIKRIRQNAKLFD